MGYKALKVKALVPKINYLYTIFNISTINSVGVKRAFSDIFVCITKLENV